MVAFVCPHCHVAAHFTHKWSERQYGDADAEVETLTAFAWLCDNCLEPVCGVFPEGGREGDETVWPETIHRKDYPDVPEAIASAGSEAHQALGAKAPRAAVAMARAVVEATAKDKGITINGIHGKIEQLAAQGHIDEDTKEAAHEVRLWGNEVAHGDLVDEPFSVADATEIVDLMDVILERVYQVPARVARIRASREARKPQVPTQVQTV